MSFACGSCSEVFDDRSPLYFHVVNVHYTLLHFRLAPDRPGASLPNPSLKLGLLVSCCLELD
jgi:hypothetical protein